MEFLPWVGLALWWGVFTSIQPCPLATNIAAISYVARRVDRPRDVFLSALLYTLGRTLAYVSIGVALTMVLRAGFEQFDLSNPLQSYVNRLLGPLLIVVAMVLLELVSFGLGGGVSERMQKRVDALGIWGAGLLGIVFALSFCPLSAALFFGTLIPIALKVNSYVVLPSLYGIGTALPVVVFAVLITLSAQSVGKAYNALSQFAWWARRITGVVFLIVGIHFTLVHIFDISPFWFPWLAV